MAKNFKGGKTRTPQALAKNISQDVHGAPCDPWTYLAIAIVAQAIADKWKMDEEKVDVLTPTGRTGYKVFRHNLNQFFNSRWFSVLVSSTEYTEEEFLRIAGEMIQEDKQNVGIL